MDKAKRFTIVTTNDGSVYEGLRDLWCEVFGDEPSFVDALYSNFGSDVIGYAVTDPDGAVCSALTCFKCGTFNGRPVYVSYAVCTREDMRGQGLASVLTRHVMDEVVNSGGISIVSPAESSLEDFYASLGYEPFFFAIERAVMSAQFDDEEYMEFNDYDLDFGDEDNGEAFKPVIDMQSISAEKYNRFREAFLSGRPHIELSEEMLRLIEAETADGCSLYSINRGDAICALSEAGNGRTVMAEFILNPVLEELSLDIDNEITTMIVDHFGDVEAVYRSPGGGRCQSMAYGHVKVNDDEYGEPYFGFPVDQ